MDTIKLSAHAESRISSRLASLVTREEVENRVNMVSSRIRDYRTYILIKKIRYIEIADPHVKPDGIARGDMLIALVENGIIETIILRKSWSQSPEFKKILH